MKQPMVSEILGFGFGIVPKPKKKMVLVVGCLKLHNCYHIAITMLFACSFVFHFRALLTSKAISDKICVFACLLYCITLHIYVQKVILHTTNKEAEHFMFIFRFKKAFLNKKQNFFCKRTPTYIK